MGPVTQSGRASPEIFDVSKSIMLSFRATTHARQEQPDEDMDSGVEEGMSTVRSPLHAQSQFLPPWPLPRSC